MPKRHPPYSPEFHRQMVDLARADRAPDDLAREFEPTAQSIRNWIAQADKRDELLPVSRERAWMAVAGAPRSFTLAQS